MRSLLRILSPVYLVGIVLAGIVLLPATAGAQEVARGWLPWIGCWQSAAERVAGDTAVLCVVPSGSGIEAVSVVNDVVTGIDVLAGEGTSLPVQNDGCSGTRRAEGSSRGNLLFVSGEYRCDGRPAQKVAGLHAFGAGPRWIDIQVAAIPNAPDIVRVRYYARMAIPTPLAGRLSNELVARATEASERAGQSSIGVNDIIESSSRIPASALETLLLETRGSVPVAKRDIVAMDKARVATSVIDLMVALAYPAHFDIRAGGPGLMAPMPVATQEPQSPEIRAFLNPFAPAEIGLAEYDRRRGFLMGMRTMDPYGIDRFRDYGYYDYEPGQIFYNAEASSGPAGSNGPALPHGSVQNGKGYSKGADQSDPSSGSSLSSGSSPAPRTESDSKVSGDGYSSGSSGGSAGGRTAVER